MGVQFPELLDFRSKHFGLFWKVIGEGKYPKFDDKPRVPVVSEPFPRRPVITGVNVQIARGGTPERVWYAAESDSELFQLQADRFIFNWRDRTKSKYPRYSENSKEFFNGFEDFRGFCKDQALEDPRPNLCEVSYINQLIPREDESAIELFGKVFTGLRWDLADEFLPSPEVASFNRVYVIGDEKGRLYAEASIARRPDSHEDFVLFKLTARVNHESGEASEVRESLQLAHDWVVNAFASLTDPAIQDDRWERKR